MCMEHITSFDKISYKPFRSRGPVPNVSWKARNFETPSRLPFRTKNLDFYRQHNSDIHLLPIITDIKLQLAIPRELYLLENLLTFPITKKRHAIWKNLNQTYYENRLITPDQVIKSIISSIKYKNTMESRKTMSIYPDILQMLVAKIEKS